MAIIEVNLDDYLSEYEKKSIAKQAFYDKCANKYMNDHERLFTNAAYSVVAEMVNKEMDNDVSTIIKNKAISIIQDMSSYSIFKAPDAWERGEASKGFTILQKALDESAHLIQSRVEAIIGDLESAYITERLNELMCEVVRDRLIGKSYKEEI